MKTSFQRVIAGLVASLIANGAFAQTTPVVNYGYNTANQLTGTTEPNGQTHAFEYNEFGEVSRHRPANPVGTGTSGQVDYGYNGRGHVTSVTDPRALVTTYSLDGLGQASALSSPDTGSSTASYDEAGNPTLQSDARGKTGTLVFDALDRPTAVNYSGSSVTLGYDAGYGVGKLTSMTDSSGSTAWTFDKLGRVTQKAQTTGAVTLTTGYTYLAGGRVATMTYPSGVVVGFTYDGANVASITVNGATVVSGVTYFPFGGPKGWAMGSIGSYVRQMDVHGRITSHTSEYGTRTLTWDASSRLTNVAETGQPARTYTYDNLNRLVTASESASRGYAYDLTGNRTGETVNGTPYAYSVDSSSNRLSSSANDNHSSTYAFDASGNTTGDGTRSFTYDDVGQLVSVSSSSGAAQYGYNGTGQRVSKATSTGSKYYSYAEDGVSLAGEYGPAGAAAPVVETVYLAGLPVLALTGGAVYYVLPDHLATPRAIKDQAGAVVWRWTSDAFGNGVANENPLGGTQFAFNQRFPGQQFDTETGLYYNNARYYDPQVGRYITSDPLGLAGGMGTYSYANLSPTTVYDDSGNFGVVGALLGGGLDLAFQLLTNDGQLKCVNWGSVGLATAMGAMGGGLVNGVGKFKKGSNAWASTRSWLQGKQKLDRGPGGAFAHVNGNEYHHWLIEQNSKIGKFFSDRVKNQPWNLNPMTRVRHLQLHGNVADKSQALNFMERWWHGTPSWAKGVEVGAATAYTAALGGGCGCSN